MNEKLEKEELKDQEQPQEFAQAPEEEPKDDAYEEPTWEESHEDVPDVVDGGSTEESLEEERKAELEEVSSPEIPEENVEQPQEKMLTQSQVNELVGRARQEGRMSAVKELLERYGVGDENELNDVFGRGQAYDSLNDEYTNQGRMYAEVMAENALLKSQVDFNRWEDVKLILNGKGLEVNEENIEALLPSHPEWKQMAQQDSANTGPVGTEPINNANAPQPSIIHKMGEDASPDNDDMSEEELVRKLYGI